MASPEPKRLADRVAGAKLVPTIWHKDASVDFDHGKIAEFVAGSQIIVADNVADYYFQNFKIRREKPLFDNFPMLVLPFPQMWIETRCSEHLKATEEFAGGRQPAGWAGMFVQIERDLLFDEACGSLGIELEPALMSRATRGIWADLVLFTDRDKILYGIGQMALVLDANGTVLASFPRLPEVLMRDRSTLSAFEREALAASIGSMALMLPPLLFAVSLMNCNNVELRQELPNAKLSRAHQKRTGRPLYRFHTLDVRPVKQVADAQPGESAEERIQRALHICRGHFKNYGEKGLFGKYRGQYWWDAHVRGQASRGMVDKEYVVHPDTPAKND